MADVVSGLDMILRRDEPTGHQTVPDALMGCWRRNWIRFGAAGRPENDVSVVWLQTASGMGDLRVDPAQPAEQTDSSCGITVVDESTTPYVTADWIDGPSGFAQQAVSSYPEKGWLTWDSPSIMRELAPSGAYVEEWERLPDSGGPVAHLISTDSATTTNLYVAGQHALLAARSANAGGVHEYSWAVRSPSDDTYLIELSTIAELIGQQLRLDHAWELVSLRHI